MRILFIGDVIGKTGRNILKKHLIPLKKELNCDFVIVNGENSANGFGITNNVYLELLKCGADAITSGNHVWDNSDIIQHIDNWDKFIRPANVHPSAIGVGYRSFTTNKGKILVINLLGRVFMDLCDDPFRVFDTIYQDFKDHIIIVDFHAEATGEKNAFGLYVDGKASLIVGTHTHVQTNDLRLLPKGSAYISDAGMCGSLDSIIGMDKELGLNRYISYGKKKNCIEKIGRMVLNGVWVEVDEVGKVIDYNLVKIIDE